MMRLQLLALVLATFTSAQSSGSDAPIQDKIIEDQIVPGCADRKAGTLPVSWCYPPIADVYTPTSNITSNVNGTSSPWRARSSLQPFIYRQIAPPIVNMRQTCEPAVTQICDLIEQVRKVAYNENRGYWYSSVVNDTVNDANKCLVGFKLPYDWYDNNIGIHPPTGSECRNNILGPLLETLDATGFMNLNASVNVEAFPVLDTKSIGNPSNQDGHVFLVERLAYGDPKALAMNESLPQFLIAPIFGNFAVSPVPPKNNLNTQGT